MIKQVQLNAMSNTQLEALQRKVQKTLDGRSDETKKAKALVHVSKLAKKYGYSLDDLVVAGHDKKRVGKRPSAMAGRKVPPKYQDPDNHDLKWSGRGRNPKWVNAALGRGLSMEDLKIR